MEKLLSGEPQYGAAAPASGPGDGAEAAELAAEVAAMAAMAAGLGAPPPGPSAALPRASSFSGAAAASEDVDMAAAGAEGEGEADDATAAAAGAGGRVPRSLNLPDAGYLQDSELMQQLGWVACWVGCGNKASAGPVHTRRAMPASGRAHAPSGCIRAHSPSPPPKALLQSQCPVN